MDERRKGVIDTVVVEVQITLTESDFHLITDRNNLNEFAKLNSLASCF
jgi:hypothetical protein